MAFNSGSPTLMHAADLHVGDSRNLPGYLDRQEKMLYQLTDICVRRKVDVAAFAGDLFDAKHMLDREKDMFLRWLVEHDRVAEKNGFYSVFMNGNHDEIEEGYTHLHKHKILMDYGLVHRTKVIESDPDIAGPFAGRIYVAAVPAKHYVGDEINTVVAALRKSLDTKLEVKGVDPKSIYFVVMVHDSIVGAVNEARNWVCKKGPRLDPTLDVTYWALGDIHKPFQKVMPNAWYSGSPIQHEFGDKETERGVLVVDLDRPTEPEPVFVVGVTPLVTVSAVPEEWPADAIIRFEGTTQEISDTVFPTNVVGFKPVLDEDAVRAVVDTDGHDMLDGLPALLIEQSVPEDMQADVVAEIESALAAL
jgi:DNA repair exonuclease SbcCD nuclease subunit